MQNRPPILGGGAHHHIVRLAPDRLLRKAKEGRATAPAPVFGPDIELLHLKAGRSRFHNGAVLFRLLHMAEEIAQEPSLSLQQKDPVPLDVRRGVLPIAVTALLRLPVG